MKNSNIFILIIITISPLFSCEEEKLSFDAQGILLLSIYDTNTGEPVANADVIAYLTLDNWAFDENRLGSFTSNEEGAVIIDNYQAGEYHFDIVIDDKNNWQNPTSHRIEDGMINQSFDFVQRTINGILSTAEGREWRITRVYDVNGNDISKYECLTDNIINFTKAGAYEMRDMSHDCDSIDNFFEASWWGIGTSYMGLVYDDGATVIDFYISALTNNRFVATQYIEGDEVNYVYELN